MPSLVHKNTMLTRKLKSTHGSSECQAFLYEVLNGDVKKARGTLCFLLETERLFT